MTIDINQIANIDNNKLLSHHFHFTFVVVNKLLPARKYFNRDDIFNYSYLLSLAGWFRKLNIQDSFNIVENCRSHIPI